MSSVVSKLALLLNAVSDPWVNVSEVAGRECALDVTVQATVNQCGQDIGSTVIYFVGVIVGWVMPPVLAVLHGITFTSASPV